jgi:polysaccharide deacetylase family sporulation protein PdaB
MRIYVFRRQWWTAAGCLCIAAVMFWLVSHPNAVGAAASQRQLPIYSVEVSEEQKKVAISFDAAWGNEDTETLIHILSSFEVPATFFVVGDWVDKYPESVKALHDAGHDVMNHSNTHPYMTQCSAEEVVSELESCNDKIEAITGLRPTLFRFPYGDYDDQSVNAVRSLDMEPIQWDVDSLDWKGISAEEITNNVVNKVKSGSIVLFHNAADHTPEALPNIISTLQYQGYQFVKVADLIVDGEYTIDNNGMQCPAE